jgi:hypothetical protein
MAARPKLAHLDVSRGKHRGEGDGQPPRHLQEQDGGPQEREKAFEECHSTPPPSARQAAFDERRRREPAQPGAVSGRIVFQRTGLAGEASAFGGELPGGGGVGRAAAESRDIHAIAHSWPVQGETRGSTDLKETTGAPFSRLQRRDPALSLRA